MKRLHLAGSTNCMQYVYYGKKRAASHSHAI